MKKLLPAILCGLPLVPPIAHAENAVALAVQRLHLSPQQLLSLRDFLGIFNSGVAIEGSVNGLFVLREARSMTYTGEFSMRTDGKGTLIIDRVNGPATVDLSREVQVPLRLDAKARLQATAALAEAQALSADGTTQAAPPMLGLAGATPTNGTQSAGVLQSRAVFFRDGSGYAATVRAQIAPAQTTPAPLRIAERYYAPMKSDGKSAWRSTIVEVDGETPIGFAELEARYSCSAPGPCRIHGSLPAPGNFHVIRWGRQSIAAVPAVLMAQLATPQITPVQDGPPATADVTAPQTAAPDAPPAPLGVVSAPPQHPNGT